MAALVILTYITSEGDLLTHYRAMAWLRDQRRDTQSVMKTTAPKFRNRAKISTERKPCDGLL